MRLLGEYPVSIDNKGRLRVPSVLLRQLTGMVDTATDGNEPSVEFVVNKGAEKCLWLWPKQVWDAQVERLSQLNTFNERNRLFVQRFYSGAYPMTTDSADRVLLQKPLMDYAGISDEAILQAQGDKIEIWEPAAYEEHQIKVNAQFSDLSDMVMGGGETGIGQKVSGSDLTTF